MRVLAVDFGTSTTVAALSVDGGPVRLVTLDGSSLMPSAVFLTEAGTLAVGRDAERQSRLDPARYEPNPKRRIDESEVLLGDSALPVVDMIAQVLRHVGDEVKRQLGAPADELRLTHPARWGSARRKVLVAAARQAGLVPEGVEPILIPEPVAAASHFASGATTGGPASVDVGSTLAVYDLGAGTFDVAVLKKGENGWEVLSEAGLPDLGGLDFEHSIIQHIAEARGGEFPDDWAELMKPSDAATRRLARAFTQDVKDAKESLSRFPQTDVAMPEPFRDVHLTRAEFESLIRPQLQRSTELLAAQVDRAGLIPKDLSGVYLVGGSSRIPLVAKLIQQGLGITPSTLDQPETSVASGAILTGAPAGSGATGAAVPTVGPLTGGMAPAQPASGVQPVGMPSTGGVSAPNAGPQSGTWQNPPAAYAPQTGPQTGQRPAPQQRPLTGPQTGAQPGPRTGAQPSSAGMPRPQSGQWTPGPQGLGRPPAYPTGSQPVQRPATGTQATARGGQQPPGGPANLASAQQGGMSSGRKTLIAVLAAALVGTLVFLGIQIFSSGGDDGGGGTDTAAAAEEQAAKEYAEYFPEGLRDYLKPAMVEFTKCKKNDPAEGETTCVLKNKLTLVCADMGSSGFTSDMQIMYGDGTSDGGLGTTDFSASTWQNSDNSRSGFFGTFVRWDISDAWDGEKPGVYWGINNEFACVYSEPEDTQVDLGSQQIQDSWEKLFKH